MIRLDKWNIIEIFDWIHIFLNFKFTEFTLNITFIRVIPGPGKIVKFWKITEDFNSKIRHFLEIYPMHMLIFKKCILLD